jgi:hypothetical protein
MNFTLVDAESFTLATLAYGVILFLPGLALGHFFDVSGFRVSDDAEKRMSGIVLGSVLLPLIDSVVLRFTTLDCALALNLGLAVAGLGLLVLKKWDSAPTRLAVTLTIVWFAIALFEWIDLDTGVNLYQPLTTFDTVKHAATIQAIHDSGAPPFDPFFLRPERVSYYYFFYTLPALAERLGGGLFDARAAFGGLTVWTGLALFGALRLFLDRGGFLPDGTSTARSRLVLVLLAASGFDAVAVTIRALWTGSWVANPLAWNEPVTDWFEGLLWVPHHIVALIALLVGVMAAVESLETTKGARLRAALVASLAFAAMLGLSVWVTLAGATAAAVWFTILLIERRWQACATLAAIGLVSLVCAAPQLHDLAAGRGGPLPIVLTVRSFSPADLFIPPGPLRLLARLVSLPLNYLLEFGVIAVGSWLYWRNHLKSGTPTNELNRVLAIMAVSGLLFGSFMRSILFNNDLGWRTVLLPSAAGLVWTVAWLGEARFALRSRVVAISLAAGYLTTLYTFVSLRFYYAALPTMPVSVQIFGAHPETQLFLRRAYNWANEHMPAEAVLQHDPHGPDVSTRSIAFGLYSRNRVAVSDRFGSLFGADLDDVSARLAELAPLFETDFPLSEVVKRARANHIDALVATSDDFVWQQPHSWVWSAPTLYANAHVRIVQTESLPIPRSDKQP